MIRLARKPGGLGQIGTIRALVPPTERLGGTQTLVDADPQFDSAR